tara:strand:+ start:947 stop:2383 length:1437 start_codon:yes stop_codon:yes gene_type:complete
MEDVDKYFEKYNNIENLILDNKISDEEDILIHLKDDLKTINKYKNLVNKSKAIMIKINKSKHLLQNKKKMERSINHKIDLLNHHNITTLSLIVDSYKTYLNINYDSLNAKIENILLNINKFQYLDFYSVINNKKLKKNNLEKLIHSINFKNSFLFSPKIIFFDIFDVFDSYSTIINFLEKFNYIYYKKTKKMLKRGFLFEACDKNIQKDYIVKFQPNKSFMEILINKYLSKHNHLHDFILYPDYFFINKNNSYFYIIEKYDCDLYQFMKKRKTPLDDFQIILILQFLIKIIYYLHKLNIIYADIKLENIIVKINSNYNIKKIKLIDFDVSLFDILPNELSDFDPKILKLLNNKKPRGTKIYMSKNNSMEKSNDIYSLGTLIIILFYKNIMKILCENEEMLSDNLLSKMYNRLTFYKNKLENDEYKIKLMKYIFRIYNDRRFSKYWTHQISMKDIYINVKKCINQTISIDELFNEFVII